MGSQISSVPVIAAQEQPAVDAPKPKKICCACPDTRKIRDECVVNNGEDLCVAAIEAHKKCLRSEGFDVRAARHAATQKTNQTHALRCNEAVLNHIFRLPLCRYRSALRICWPALATTHRQWTGAVEVEEKA